MVGMIKTLALVGSLMISAAIHGNCENATPGLERFYSTGWGIDHGNQRYQRDTTINAGNAAQLELKWVYGFASNAPRVHPLVTEDTIFIGDEGRGLVALDRETGCVRWENAGVQDISTAISHGTVNGKPVLVFSGRQTGAVAVDAATGEEIWRRFVDDFNPVPMFSGSPLVYENQVFVPISSMEIALSLLPFYGCCSTSGGMAALDLATGEVNWALPTVMEEVQVTGRHWLFVERRGPSGAPVWGAPMLDSKRRQLYYGTGQNYSHPATDTSDAIFAVNIDTGKPVWIAQFTENDAYNLACGGGGSGGPNCPDPVGPDVDFGAPPILVTLADGRDAVLAGQKSGDVWAIDPVTGETIWTTRIGRGGALGGVHWGMAVDQDAGQLFVPVSDIAALSGTEEPEPGLFALDINDGSRTWAAPRVQRCEGRRCWSGLSSGITAGPGIVVTGGLDGQLEVYHSATGNLLWSFDSLIDFEAVNGIPTRGGAFDAHGPMLADNLLIVASGYGSFGQTGGNALLVFEVSAESAP